MPSYPKVALVFKTRFEENQRILKAISNFNRFHENWTAFVDDQAVSQSNPSWLLKKRWDGVITKHTAPDLISSCVERSIPIVDLSDDNNHYSNVPKIRPDNVALGHKGAEYFKDKGYQHYAFCGFSSEDWARDREDGFTEALKLSGHTLFTFDSAYPKVNEPEWEETEERKIRDWLKNLPNPLALMCCNDLRALQVINACRDLELQVPEDVAILGVNNETVRCELSIPQLSSIPINTEYYGHMAAKAITGMITGKDPEFRELFIDPLDVVSRRSTDALCIDDKQIAAALHIIKRDACSGLSVDQIVDQMHVSRSMLERRFRKYLGKSPQMEIRTVQMQKIKQLLRETNYTLAHIADLAGFDHPEYMSVVFKKMMHLTPIQYRKQTGSQNRLSNRQVP